MSRAIGAPVGMPDGFAQTCGLVAAVLLALSSAPSAFGQSPASLPLSQRERLTGDWPEALADSGVTLDLRYSSSYQGLESGTGSEESGHEYGGKADLFFNLDFGKIGQFWERGELRIRRDIAESVLLARVKERLLSDDVVAYVQEQMRKAVDSLSGDSDAANLEAEIGYLAAKIDKLIEAIESIGISDTLAERLRRLEREKRDAESRLATINVDREPLAALPDLIPSLMCTWRGLVAQMEALPDNPHARPSDIETARRHLGALLGKVEIRSKHGVP